VNVIAEIYELILLDKTCWNKSLRRDFVITHRATKRGGFSGKKRGPRTSRAAVGGDRFHRGAATKHGARSAGSRKRVPQARPSPLEAYFGRRESLEMR